MVYQLKSYLCLKKCYLFPHTCNQSCSQRKNQDILAKYLFQIEENKICIFREHICLYLRNWILTDTESIAIGWIRNNWSFQVILCQVEFDWMGISEQNNVFRFDFTFSQAIEWSASIGRCIIKLTICHSYGY